MSSVRAIRRSATDHKVAGVCGGLAREWGVDPVLVRLGWALLALSGGLGIVLYLAGWLLIARDGRDHSAVVDLLGHRAGSWPRGVWLVLVTISCLIAVSVLGSLAPFGLGPAVILALVWYFGYYKTRPQRSQPDAVTPPRPHIPVSGGPVPGPAPWTTPGNQTPFTQAAAAWRLRIDEAQHGVVTSAAQDYPEFLSLPDPVGLYAEPLPVPVRPTSIPIRRSSTRAAKRLRLGSLMVLGLVLSALGLADRLGTAVPAAVYFAAALLVLGLTLVAAAFLGRARGLLPVALLVLVGTVTSAVAGPVAFEAGWRNQQVSYTHASQLTGDSAALGRLQVDLARLSLTSNASYSAHLGIGSLEVSVPPGSNVMLHYAVTSGAVVVNQRPVREGSHLSGTLSLPGTDRRQPTLILNLSVDRGVVQVRR